MHMTWWDKCNNPFNLFITIYFEIHKCNNIKAIIFLVLEVLKMRIAVTKRSALIIVDMQNDFMPGGSLPVKDADKIIPAINRYIEIFYKSGRLIVATRDWHPENHISFKERGGPWPKHCVQNTYGAEFHPSLKLPDKVLIIDKATHPDRDAYSAFQETYLDLELRRHNIRRVFVSGVAIEYCVKATVLDALELGYEVILLTDAIKGVELKPGNVDNALRKMVGRGTILAEYNDIDWEE